LHGGYHSDDDDDDDDDEEDGDEEENDNASPEAPNKNASDSSTNNNAILKLKGRKNLHILEELAVEDRDTIQQDGEEEDDGMNEDMEENEEDGDSYYTGTDEDADEEEEEEDSDEQDSDVNEIFELSDDEPTSGKKVMGGKSGAGAVSTTHGNRSSYRKDDVVKSLIVINVHK